VGLCPTGTIVKGAQGYRVLVGGKLGRHPRLASELEGIHSKEEAFRLVEKCLDHYMEHNREGDRFGQILERTGIEFLRDAETQQRHR
jgi:dissimilatory sulfite reductase (desulfoviridin) alpha/beta subunit